MDPLFIQYKEIENAEDLFIGIRSNLDHGAGSHRIQPHQPRKNENADKGILNSEHPMTCGMLFWSLELGEEVSPGLLRHLLKRLPSL